MLNFLWLIHSSHTYTNITPLTLPSTHMDTFTHTRAHKHYFIHMDILTHTYTHNQYITHTTIYMHGHSHTHYTTHIAIHKHILSFTATHFNKHTNNRTLRSTNKMILNAPDFSQTAFLYSAHTLWNGLPSKLKQV